MDCPEWIACEFWKFQVEATLRKKRIFSQTRDRIFGDTSQKSSWAMGRNGVELGFGLTGIKCGRNRTAKMHEKNHFLKNFTSKGERWILYGKSDDEWILFEPPRVVPHTHTHRHTLNTTHTQREYATIHKSIDCWCWHCRIGMVFVCGMCLFA